MTRILALLALLPLAFANLEVPQDIVHASSDLAAEGASIPSPNIVSSQEAERMPAAPSVTVITSPEAKQVMEAAVKKAAEIKIPSNIAITDPYGHLMAFVRMDGAVLASIDVAQRKARTVSMFNGRFRSGDLFNATSPGGALYGIQHTNNGLVFFGGGIPLKKGDVFIGAIGVSGGSVDQDISVAEAAAKALS